MSVRTRESFESDGRVNEKTPNVNRPGFRSDAERFNFERPKRGGVPLCPTAAGKEKYSLHPPGSANEHERGCRRVRNVFGFADATLKRLNRSESVRWRARSRHVCAAERGFFFRCVPPPHHTVVRRMRATQTFLRRPCSTV